MISGILNQVNAAGSKTNDPAPPDWYKLWVDWNASAGTGGDLLYYVDTINMRLANEKANAILGFLTDMLSRVGGCESLEGLIRQTISTVKNLISKLHFGSNIDELKQLTNQLNNTLLPEINNIIVHH